MNPYLRNVLVILGALIIGSIVNGGLINLSGSIFPPPEGVDPNDIESIKANLHRYQPKHWIMPFLAHALGTLAGAYFAARLVTRAPAFWGFFIGVLFLLGGIAAANMIGGPLWFIVVDLVLAYIPFALLANVLAKRKRSDW